MVHYKLTYFNGRGRAELVRMVFAAAGVDYEDVRIEKDKWPALKPKTPFGQVPIFEIDGKPFCQSVSIARYLARKFKLAGKSELEELQADMLVDCMEDTVKPMLGFWFEKDEARKAELKKKYSEETLPAYLTSLEDLLKSNNGGNGYFVGNELTWADLNFLSVAMWLKMSGDEAVLNKHPKLKALQERVEKLPKIAAWIAKRPATEF